MGRKYYKRAFLNKEGQGSSAHIIAEINSDGCDIKIADCNRSITLENAIEKPTQRDNAIHKLTILRDTMDEMIHKIKSIPVVIKFKKPYKRKSTLSQQAAEDTLSLKYNKTALPKGSKIKNLVSFWQIEKEHKYAALVHNNQAKVRKYQVLFYKF